MNWWSIRQAKAAKCSPASMLGSRSSSRARRRKRLAQAKLRSTTQPQDLLDDLCSSCRRPFLVFGATVAVAIRAQALQL